MPIMNASDDAAIDRLRRALDDLVRAADRYQAHIRPRTEADKQAFRNPLHDALAIANAEVAKALEEQGRNEK